MQEKTSLFTDAVSRLLSIFALVKDIVFSRQIGFVKPEEKGRACFAEEEDDCQLTTNREQYQACPKLCRIATEEDKVKEEDLTSYFIAHPFTEWETLQNTKKSRIDIF